MKSVYTPIYLFDLLWVLKKINYCLLRGTPYFYCIVHSYLIDFINTLVVRGTIAKVVVIRKEAFYAIVYLCVKDTLQANAITATSLQLVSQDTVKQLILRQRWQLYDLEHLNIPGKHEPRSQPALVHTQSRFIGHTTNQRSSAVHIVARLLRLHQRCNYALYSLLLALLTLFNNISQRSNSQVSIQPIRAALLHAKSSLHRGLLLLSETASTEFVELNHYDFITCYSVCVFIVRSAYMRSAASGSAT